MKHFVPIRTLVLSVGLGAAIGLPTGGYAAVSVTISVGAPPPAIPVYAQPICPGPGYLWTPGYWSYGPRGYGWIPGAWVRPPAPGLLWTPAWWGWEGGRYRFHRGYWGPQVGFYGGTNYGYGYPGHGFEGGEWRGREFYYNSAVSHVDAVHMRNIYRREHHFEEHDHYPQAFREQEHQAPGEGWRHEDHHDNGLHQGWDHEDDGGGHGHGRGHDR